MEPVSLIRPTVAALIVIQVQGYLWYGPMMFGDRWLKAMKASNPKFKPQPDLSVVLWTTVVWAVSAAMYAWLRAMTGAEELTDLCTLSAISWLAFSVPNGAFSVLYENRSREVSIIGQAYLLVAFLLMAVLHWLL